MMSFEMDEEILQDFLIEAGEILELLSEQLVDLEKFPEDRELLNAIFRGFHTVKGGAGFLSLTELVDTCHGAENIFDNLRNGGRKLTPEVMDIILQALDTVNEQFACVQQRQQATAADLTLLRALHTYSRPAVEDKVIEETTGLKLEPEAISKVPFYGDNAIAGDSTDEITDDEFDRLLDELHGSGKSPLINSNATSPPLSSPDTSVKSSSGDDMTDDDFENLLNILHGNSPIEDKSKENTHEDPSPVPKVELKPAPPPQKLAPSAQPPSVAAKPPVKAEERKIPVPQMEQTVRVNTSTLDKIMNMVGELVLVRNRLVSLSASSDNENMVKAVTNLDVVTADLQGAVMQTRMQPIKKVFGRFPRVIRDLARNLNKDIVLKMRGEETDLDKNLVEALADPMVHLVRNSVDHGIEMPDAREKKSKSRVGTVTLAASQEGNHILLTIEDDGGGMDTKILRGIAVDRGVMDADAAARLTDIESFNLIFAPGFSTKAEISDISGRGVGMDVVKTAISQLNGTISIDSVLGKGTIISIKVPLTLAILPTLMVGIGNSPYAFPLSNVNEIISLDLAKTNTVDSQLTLIVRDKVIPLFYLQDWLCQTRIANRKIGHVVIVQIGQQPIAFVVDSLIGQEEVVIKPLDELLQGTPGIAGATITSDGHIALILDVPNLLKRYSRQ